MSRITQQITKFNAGMTPDLYGGGITRIEHFDLTTPQARPFRGLVASTLLNGTIDRLVKFTRGVNNRLYAMCRETGTGYGSTALWDNSNYRWEAFQTLNAAGAYAEVILFYNGNLYGLWKGANMWKVTCSANGATATALDGAFKSLTYSNTCDPIIHSKDGLSYWVADNKLYSFDGTTLSAALLTLPTNFIITKIAEQGDYINIIGYNSQTSIGTSFLWDRDSSLATLTAKYDLGVEIPHHNATLGGTHFIISKKISSSNSQIQENPTLLVRYINGDKAEILNEFYFTALNIGGGYIDNDRLYFNANVIFLGDSAAHWVVFNLDSKGKLSIAQNVGINDAGGSRADHPGIFRDGDDFYIGGGADGAWNTGTTYSATVPAFVVFSKVRGKSFQNNLDLVGVISLFEALPSGASVLVKYRKDEETSWTTLGTFSTDNDLKGAITAAEASNPRAMEFQFRIDSLGGAVLTGFQSDCEEVGNESYS